MDIGIDPFLGLQCQGELGRHLGEVCANVSRVVGLCQDAAESVHQSVGPGWPRHILRVEELTLVHPITGYMSGMR